jgi:hypothetical protein
MANYFQARPVLLCGIVGPSTCKKILKKKPGDLADIKNKKILVVLLGQRCPILRHGQKKIRQEKGEEEKQKVTFALPSLFLFTNTGPQGRCFLSEKRLA